MKRGKRVKHETDYGIDRRNRRPQTVTTKKNAPAARDKNDPTSKNIEIVWVSGGGPERESSGDASRDNEADTSVCRTMLWVGHVGYCASIPIALVHNALVP